MKSVRFVLFVVLAMASTIQAFAFTVSSDQQYYVYDDGSYRFIYSDEYRPFVKALAARNGKLKSFYESDFNWKLDEKPYLILASPRNQIANGFATTLPTLHTVFYGGGAETVDDFSAGSWLNTLLVHETAHLYQTDAKQSYSKFLHSALGNPLPNVLPPFTYMTAPNIFLPTFILEGNATYNEGRFGNGGRLYNGENRALFLSLLKAGKVNSKRLMNDHILWPYGREKYVVGAYVQQYLGQKYGVDKVNAFFLKNSRHFINPFLLRKSFFETFGVGYEDVLRDLNTEFKSYAASMKTSDPKLEPIARSITQGGLYRDGNRVLFMTTTGKEMPYLYEVEKAASGLKISKKKRNMPFGRPLKVNGDIYVASGEQTGATEIRYSVFGDNFSQLERFDNKFVYDISGKQAVYADVPKSFEKVQLYQNGKFLAAVDSGAQLDDDGKALFFKQAGDQRTLYRDGFAVATYKGYYGKIADTAKNGDVYIIAASERGSTLYRVRNRVISRALTSDVVVDAALVSDTEVLVAEITDEGFSYKVVPLENETSEQPFYYEYFYDKDPSMKFFLSEATTPAVLPRENEKRAPNQATGGGLNPNLPDTAQWGPSAGTPTNKIEDLLSKSQEDRYSTLRYTKFDGIDPFFAGVTLGGDVLAGVAARFSDPMQFHSLNFAYAHLEGDTNDGLLYYQNRFHRLNWLIGGIFDQSAIIENEGEEDEKILARYQTYKGVFQLQYPIYQRPLHGLDLVVRYTYEYDDTNDSGIILDREQKVLSYIDFGHHRAYPIAFESNASDRFVIAHEAVGDIPKWAGDRNHYAALVSFKRDIFRQSYLTAGYHAVRSDAEKADIEIQHTSISGISLDLENPAELTRYSSESGIRYREAHQANFKFKQAFDLGVYFSKFPFSLRRLAPFVEYNEYYGRTDREGGPETLFHELAGGVEFEFLFVHKFPIRITAAGYESSARDGYDLTVFSSVAQAF